MKLDDGQMVRNVAGIAILVSFMVIFSAAAVADWGKLRLESPGTSDIDSDYLDGFDATSFLLKSGGTMTGNLDMNGYQIQNYFNNNCGNNELISSVNSDGSFNCESVGDAAAQNLSEVLIEGDVANQSIDMDGNNIVLDSGYLSNDGGNEGVRVYNNGNVDVSGGRLTVSYSSSSPLTLQGTHIGGNDGTPDTGWNYMTFDDSEGDRMGYIGFDPDGQLRLDNDVGSNVKLHQTDLNMSGNDVEEVNWVGYSDRDGDGNNMWTGVDTSDMWSVYSDGLSDEALRVYEGGNVEIPNGDLSLLDGDFSINSDTNNDDPALLIKDSGTDKIDLFYDTSTSQVALYSYDAGSRILEADSDGTTRLRGGNVEIPNGNLNMSDNSIVEFFSSDCSSGEAVTDVNDDGSLSCTDIGSETSDLYVDEDGDSMTGFLNMTGDRIHDAGSGNIDIGDGEGAIAMNGQEIKDGGLVQVSRLGVTDSYSTADSQAGSNSVYVEGNVSVDGDIVGAGADVAEKINSQSEIESGAVVKLSGDMSVDRTDKARDTAVAGVVSRDPAMVMAKERDGVPIAMTGTVPVKFSDENGGVEPGDLLTTSSKEGHAMKCSDLSKCQGAIIGKAMQSQEKTGEVKILVSRG